MAIKESLLTVVNSIGDSDFVRAVTSAGASRKLSVSNLAKHIVETYTGSTIAGSAQSVKSAIDTQKSAIDSLNSKYTSYNASLTLSNSGNASLDSVIGHTADVVPVMGYVTGENTSVKIVSFARFSGNWYAHVETAAGAAVTGAVNVVIITLRL